MAVVVAHQEPFGIFTYVDYEYEQELDLLARLIASEARGEPYEGMVAVGNVVMNRAKDSSIDEVIFARHQFSGIVERSFTRTPPGICVRAAMAVLAGESTIPSTVTHYCNLKKCSPRWAKKLKFVKRIGNHWFYEH